MAVEIDFILAFLGGFFAALTPITIWAVIVTILLVGFLLFKKKYELAWLPLVLSLIFFLYKIFFPFFITFKGAIAIAIELMGNPIHLVLPYAFGEAFIPIIISTAFFLYVKFIKHTEKNKKE